MPRPRGSASAHSHLCRACQDFLELHGIPVAVINQRPVRLANGSYRTPGAPAGFPDIVAGLPPQGRMLLLEVKSGKSRLRPRQLEAGLKWTEAGALWGVIRSVTDLPEILREAGMKPLTERKAP